MKLFFISDIHGNQFALDAILKKALQVKADKIYCLGDISGYFTGINEVVGLLKKHEVLSIKGNHDAFLINETKINKEKGYHSAYLATKDIIGEKEYDWIMKLPDYREICNDNYKIEIYHGGRNNLLNEYSYPHLIDIEKYKYCTSDLFMFGHTHLQFVLKEGSKVFANPGSVGLPRNGDFRAHGLLYDTGINAFTEYKIPYDLNKFINAYSNNISINQFYLHNINFGRSSKKQLREENEPFLDSETISYLESENFSLINTNFGLIISNKEDDFSENLIYIAAYADNSLLLTSNTLIFSWHEELYCKPMIKNICKENFRCDNAGLYYYKAFVNNTEFIKNILSIIRNAFVEIKNIKNYV